MLSTRVRTLPGRTAAHAWRTALFSSATVGGGVIQVLEPDWHLIPNMLSWVHVWTPSWPVHDLNILLVQKGSCVTCCMGRGIVLNVHKVTSKYPCRPWQHLIPQDLGWTDASSWLHPPRLSPTWWIAPHTMTDVPRFPSLGWTQASISLSPCLWCTRTQPSL